VWLDHQPNIVMRLKKE